MIKRNKTIIIIWKYSDNTKVTFIIYSIDVNCTEQPD